MEGKQVTRPPALREWILIITLALTVTGFIITREKDLTHMVDTIVALEKHAEYNDKRIEALRKEVNQLERHDMKFKYKDE